MVDPEHDDTTVDLVALLAEVQEFVILPESQHLRDLRYDPERRADLLRRVVAVRAALATTVAPSDQSRCPGCRRRVAFCPCFAAGRATTADTDPPPDATVALAEALGASHVQPVASVADALSVHAARRSGDHSAEPERLLPPTLDDLMGDG